MKKCLALLATVILIIGTANAQVIIRSRPYVRARTLRNKHIPKFEPVVNFSLGYGFPDLDRNQLLDFYNEYRGTVSQTGPVFGSIDYQFMRAMSIGIMVSYGKVTAPYYQYNNSALAFTGKLQSWSVMLDFIRYIPASEKVSPYLRTAIGINIWQQNYTDPSGNEAVIASNPTDLAYQVGLGAKFKLSKQTGLFLEAGYGKYIISGGLTFKL